MKFLKALFPALMLLVAACSTTQTLPPGGKTTEDVIAACTSYAGSLNALIPFKDKLPANVIDNINKSIALTMPICSNPASYSATGAVAAVTAESGNLSTILKANGGK